MAYGIIYKITNKINQKIYIGQTIQTLTERWAGHLNTAKHDKGRSCHFVRALRKYGPDNFEIERVAEAADQDELNELEKDLIERFDSVRTGYNSTTGGEHPEWSEKSREKMRIALSLKPRTALGPSNYKKEEVLRRCLESEKLSVTEIEWITGLKKATIRKYAEAAGLRAVKRPISDTLELGEPWNGRHEDPEWIEIRNKKPTGTPEFSKALNKYRIISKIGK